MASMMMIFAQHPSGTSDVAPPGGSGQCSREWLPPRCSGSTRGGYFKAPAKKGSSTLLLMAECSDYIKYTSGNRK